MDSKLFIWRFGDDGEVNWKAEPPLKNYPKGQAQNYMVCMGPVISAALRNGYKIREGITPEGGEEPLNPVPHALLINFRYMANIGTETADELLQ